jgi:hypothetical protein
MAADPISKHALMLRNANPEAWDGFLRALDDYTNEALVALASTPADEVLRQQGRVQQCRAFLRIFKECDAPSRKPAPQ